MKPTTRTAATLTACALFSMQTMSAVAQMPSGVAAQPAQEASGASPADQQGDPPGRVVRLNYMAGTVTTEPAGASDCSYA